MRKKVYVKLSSRYGWTAEQIAKMTPYIQAVYLEAEFEDNKIQTVNTIAEAQRMIRGE